MPSRLLREHFCIADQLPRIRTCLKRLRRPDVRRCSASPSRSNYTQAAPPQCRNAHEVSVHLPGGQETTEHFETPRTHAKSQMPSRLLRERFCIADQRPCIRTCLGREASTVPRVPDSDPEFTPECHSCPPGMHTLASCAFLLSFFRIDPIQNQRSEIRPFPADQFCRRQGALRPRSLPVPFKWPDSQLRCTFRNSQPAFPNPQSQIGLRFDVFGAWDYP
jgi:hypothetical protein